MRRSEPTFNPPGLAEFLEAEKAQNTTRAMEIILRVEAMIQRTVLEELKREFGANETDWWFQGVPKAVRKKVDDRINDEQGRTGGREQNFDFIDYREITQYNWQLFESIFGDGKGSKDSRTHWMSDVNEIRKTAAHASRGVYLPMTAEQLSVLERREAWLKERIAAVGQSDRSDESADVAPTPGD